ncbi:MAG: nucleotidyltransferase domain-containing protein [Desulfohalobiaceae bacterium]
MQQTALNSTCRESIIKILDAHPEIAFAYLHGSILESTSARDIDIAVHIRPEQLPQSQFLYEDALQQEILTQATPKLPMDVRIMNQAPLPFQFQAIKGLLLVDHAPEYRLQTICYIVSRYLDLKPILNHHLREAFEDEPKY